MSIGKSSLTMLTMASYTAITFVNTLYISIFVLSLAIRIVWSETTVSVSAPVNPVRESGILSLRCQVTDLQNNHEVRISRDVGNQTQTLSWNNVIALEDDSRLFLAIRQLDDGSIVYFLTIIKATRLDEGIYSCKVVDPVKLMVISDGSTPIKFQYFPSDAPVCNPQTIPPVMAGTSVTLNCSAIGARSVIEVNWSRTGDGKLAKSKITSTNTKVFASVTFKPSLRDVGVMFFCKVTSPAFPEQMSTCHVGPLKVLPDPRGPISVEPDVKSPRPSYPILTSNVNQNTIDDTRHTLDTNDDPVGCSAICDRNSASMLYWVIATFLAGIIALVFCIMAVAVALRLHRAKRDMTTLHRIGGLQGHQEIYLELDDKFDENRIYMALDQCRKTSGNVCHPVLDTDRNYTSTPIAPMALPKRPIM